MAVLSNAHTHTIFCDGKNTAEEMVLSAIENGFVSLGFSGHSFVYPDDGYTMKPEAEKAYIAEIRRLKEKYKDRIAIHLGLELDYYSHIDLTPYEYWIGSVHHYEDPETGKRLNGPYPADRYQDVFGQVLCELAEKDERVVGITPAMASGCGMSKFAAAFPGRFFDVGIEEEHAVTFSAGLAAGGMRPFCNIYSSFAQRAYDQIIHDVALQHLPVVLCFDRAGLVGEDGATHHGCFDIAALRTVPGTIIASPKDETELKQLMYSALNTEHGPYIIRYPRGCGEGVQWKDAPYEILPAGKAVELKAGKKLALVCSGPVTSKAMKIAEKYGEDVGVYNFRFIKPLDTEMLAKIAGQYSHIITLEDGSLKGGLYGAVAEELAGAENAPTVEGIGIPDEFVRHASKDEEWVLCGMDEKSVTKKIENFLENRK